MRIFELQFNPPRKNEMSDYLLESFYYEPQNIYEKRLGTLYLIGEIFNLLPQNLNLLQRLSKIIKEKYYNLTIQNPTKSFQEALKSANDFLSQEVAKNNVSWLGNLNLIVISLVKDNSGQIFNLNLAKVGKGKIFSQNNNKINDIGKNLDLEGIEPYPLKIFTNIVTGKVREGDKIAILTSEVSEFFSKENLLENFLRKEISQEQELKEILENKKKEASNIRGIFLLIDLIRDPEGEKTRKPKLLKLEKELERFSLKEAFSPLFSLFKKVLFFFENLIAKTLSKLEFFLKKIFNLSRFQSLRFTLPIEKRLKEREKTESPKKKLHLQSLNLNSIKDIIPQLNKGLISLLLLILILGGGFFVFQKQEKEKLKEKEETLNRIEKEIQQVERFIILDSQEKAFEMLKENWNKILILSEENWKEKDRAKKLKDSIEGKLLLLSKMEFVEKPEIVFEFKENDFIPQKVSYFQESLYLFSPLAKNLFKIDLNNKEIKSFLFKEDITPKLATVSKEAILFFAEPDKIIPFKNDSFGDAFSLTLPSPEINFISLASHLDSIYFLDQQSGEIIKYSRPFKKGEFWLKSGKERIKDGKSITIDGSIFVLKENNSISRYLKGVKLGNLNFDFFPFPKKFQKIFTTSEIPYLYILDQFQNRIIILDKNGKTIKQFQSSEFNNLKDFAISPDGKIIYILNGQKIYKINL